MRLDDVAVNLPACAVCPPDGRRRVVIERVEPEIDGGRFPIKRVVGEQVVVEADVFADGHDEIAGVLQHLAPGEMEWQETPLRPLGNDRWRAEFRVDRMGCHRYCLEAWVDPFHTWSRDLLRRIEAGQEVEPELLVGAELVAEAAVRAQGQDRRALAELAERLRGPEGRSLALSPELAWLMARHPDRRHATRYERELEVWVERPRARFSAWYEMFPRSAAPEPRHGTFRDVIARLPYVADLGFDVLYLPPIHPIGHTNRKGPNNLLDASPEDVGSPWAIGGPEGGHTAVHPRLGTLDDFRQLVREAERLGIEVALDLAFQTSPDHPWVRQHPEWFRRRPDGSIRYAENPPKRYQDVYPLDFETEAWRELWQELARVVEFWIEQGVRIFRVDNPHTKPFAFWEWLIAGLRQRHPEVILLAEAFARPKVMYRLAKLGFSQSYTYFAWRNTAQELREYFTELTRTPVREYFRPSLWPNTPDILTEALQQGGLRASAIRLVLAATLGASYGIYGPVFELGETRPLVPGREEYLDSEKYQLRHWDLGQPGLQDLVRRLNRARRSHPALQQDRTLRFLRTDNEQLLAYAKASDDGADVVVAVVNLDWRWRQSGWVEVPVAPGPTYAVSDLLDGAVYEWRAGEWNYVELDPERRCAHLLAVPRPLVPEGQDGT